VLSPKRGERLYSGLGKREGIMRSNELYLQVLPIIHLGTGEAEQVLTTASSPDSATEFFPDQVGAYITMFNARQKYFSGGHVLSYELTQVPAQNGLVIVRVTQYVTD
jgi:hypothetical protein